MKSRISLKRSSVFKKLISSIMLVSFVYSLIVAPVGAQVLPVSGMSVGLTAGYRPPILLGLKVHPENPLLFDFIVDQGQAKLSQDELKAETEKLVKYFLAALTIPDKEVWVNLSPTEQDRIIPDVLGQTVMGKTMLEQDYELKQLAASLTNPETELGQKYWKKVGAEKVGDVPTFSKVWIVPAKAEVLESNGIVLVGEKRLKVMMDEERSKQKDRLESLASARAEDYERNLTPPNPLFKKEGERVENQVTPSLDKEGAGGVLTTNISAQVFRSNILPEIEKQVNEGKQFADVRQIYNSVILAAWYKQALKESLLGKVYADKSKVAGVETDDKEMKQRIYEQYLEAFKKGAYNLIKEEEDPTTGEMIPRKYFSGGLEISLTAGASSALRVARVSSTTIERNLGAFGRPLSLVTVLGAERRAVKAQLAGESTAASSGTNAASSTINEQSFALKQLDESGQIEGIVDAVFKESILAVQADLPQGISETSAKAVLKALLMASFLDQKVFDVLGENRLHQILGPDSEIGLQASGMPSDVLTKLYQVLGLERLAEDPELKPEGEETPVQYRLSQRLQDGLASGLKIMLEYATENIAENDQLAKGVLPYLEPLLQEYSIPDAQHFIATSFLFMMIAREDLTGTKSRTIHKEQMDAMKDHWRELGVDITGFDAILTKFGITENNQDVPGGDFDVPEKLATEIDEIVGRVRPQIFEMLLGDPGASGDMISSSSAAGAAMSASSGVEMVRINYTFKFPTGRPLKEAGEILRRINDHLLRNEFEEAYVALDDFRNLYANTPFVLKQIEDIGSKIEQLANDPNTVFVPRFSFNVTLIGRLSDDVGKLQNEAATALKNRNFAEFSNKLVELRRAVSGSEENSSRVDAVFKDFYNWLVKDEIATVDDLMENQIAIDILRRVLAKPYEFKFSIEHWQFLRAYQQLKNQDVNITIQRIAEVIVKDNIEQKAVSLSRVFREDLGPGLLSIGLEKINDEIVAALQDSAVVADLEQEAIRIFKDRSSEIVEAVEQGDFLVYADLVLYVQENYLYGLPLAGIIRNLNRQGLSEKDFKRISGVMQDGHAGKTYDPVIVNGFQLLIPTRTGSSFFGNANLRRDTIGDVRTGISQFLNTPDGQRGSYYQYIPGIFRLDLHHRNVHVYFKHFSEEKIIIILAWEGTGSVKRGEGGGYSMTTRMNTHLQQFVGSKFIDGKLYLVVKRGSQMVEKNLKTVLDNGSFGINAASSNVEELSKATGLNQGYLAKLPKPYLIRIANSSNIGLNRENISWVGARPKIFRVQVGRDWFLIQTGQIKRDNTLAAVTDPISVTLLKRADGSVLALFPGSFSSGEVSHFLDSLVSRRIGDFSSETSITYLGLRFVKLEGEREPSWREVTRVITLDGLSDGSTTLSDNDGIFYLGGKVPEVNSINDIYQLPRRRVIASSGVGETQAASAPTSPVGGIDFDPTNMDLQIKRDGKGVPLPLPQQNLEQINIEGLFPVIINIVPINAQTLPVLLGSVSEPAKDQAPQEPGKDPADDAAPELAASHTS